MKNHGIGLVKLKSFTMAEIMISLTIVAIVSIITLPALIGNINEKTWITQKAAFNTRVQQALGLMPSLNGYGFSETESEIAAKAAKKFVQQGLSKVLKVENICDNDDIQKCGFPAEIVRFSEATKLDTPTTLVGLNEFFNISDENVEYSQINTNAVAFETTNGEHVLTFYNPICSFNYGQSTGANSTHQLLQPTMCVNLIYDLNGIKGPNKVGKDIGFITAFFPTDTIVVSPIPVREYNIQKANFSENQEFNIGFANAQCRAKYGRDSRIANIEELESLFINRSLGLNVEGDGYLSSTPSSESGFYSLQGHTGGVSIDTSADWNSENYQRVFCVK